MLLLACGHFEIIPRHLPFTPSYNNHTHANNKKASTDTDNSSITNKLTNVSIFEIEERVTIVVYAHLKLEKAEML